MSERSAASMTEIPSALATAFRELVAAASELERACLSVGDRGVEISAPRVRRALDTVEAARVERGLLVQPGIEFVPSPDAGPGGPPASDVYEFCLECGAAQEPMYPATSVDCLISELRDQFFPVLSKTSVLTLAAFEKRVAQFKVEVES